MTPEDYGLETIVEDNDGVTIEYVILRRLEDGDIRIRRDLFTDEVAQFYGLQPK